MPGTSITTTRIPGAATGDNLPQTADRACKCIRKGERLRSLVHGRPNRLPLPATAGWPAQALARRAHPVEGLFPLISTGGRFDVVTCRPTGHANATQGSADS